MLNFGLIYTDMINLSQFLDNDFHILVCYIDVSFCDVQLLTLFIS
jgi:hypothetical protein